MCRYTRPETTYYVIFVDEDGEEYIYTTDANSKREAIENCESAHGITNSDIVAVGQAVPM